jgi:hypothetical protein
MDITTNTITAIKKSFYSRHNRQITHNDKNDILYLVKSLVMTRIASCKNHNEKKLTI